MKKGFTIVELLVVFGIIAILAGLITTAASSSIRLSRTQRASALCTLVQTGLGVYHEQEGEWPVSALNADPVSPRTNKEGSNNSNDPNLVVLNASEVRQAVKALVQKAKDKSPVMDISGLYVAREDNYLSGNPLRPAKNVYGLDFMAAVRGTEQHPKKMTTADMYFGYPDPETGKFLRFKMVYSIPSDQIIVKQQDKAGEQ